MSKYDELISHYEKGPETVEQALRLVPADLLDRAPAPGKWSVRQIVVHVADADLVAAARIRFIAAEPGCPIPGFNQDVWTSKLNYEHLSAEDALALLRAVRKSTTALLRTLPESAFENVGNHSERGPVTMASLVEVYSNHADVHAGQIRAIAEEAKAAAK